MVCDEFVKPYQNCDSPYLNWAVFTIFIPELPFKIICHDNSAGGVWNPDGFFRMMTINSVIENERKFFDNNDIPSFHFQS